MEFQKISNFLDTAPDDKDLTRFVTKKLIEVYDQSKENDSVNKEIRIKTSMLRSDLCDFSDAYINEKELLLWKVIIMLISEIKILYLKTIHHLLTAFQKLIVTNW